MTKMIKMSLAAAMVVTGLNAADTSFSGKVYVEQIASTKGANGSTVNSFDLDVDLTAKTKITDTLSSVVTIQADSDTTGGSDQNGAYGETVNVDSLYFQYANAGLAVKWGAQDIDTPNTDGDDGDGVLATYTVGNITGAAAYFPNSNLAATKGHDISAVAVLGSAGPVNFEGWQVNIAGKGAGGSSNTTIVVGGEFAGVSASVRSATTSYNAANTKDGSTLKVVVGGTVSNVSLTGIYFATDKDGAALVTDPSSANSVELVNLVHDNTFYDTTLMALIASVPVSDAGTVTVSYGTGDVSLVKSASADVDVSEYVLQYAHKLAKTTTMTARYAAYDQDGKGTTNDTEKTAARLDLTYKF